MKIYYLVVLLFTYSLVAVVSQAIDLTQLSAAELAAVRVYVVDKVPENSAGWEDNGTSLLAEMDECFGETLGLQGQKSKRTVSQKRVEFTKPRSSMLREQKYMRELRRAQSVDGYEYPEDHLWHQENPVKFVCLCKTKTGKQCTTTVRDKGTMMGHVRHHIGGRFFCNSPDCYASFAWETLRNKHTRETRSQGREHSMAYVGPIICVKHMRTKKR